MPLSETPLYAAEKEASNAAEKAERKMQLKEKVQLRYLCFPPGATQFQCKVAENFTMLLTSRARLHELAEAERGVGEAGEEVGGDTELQGPHGRREDDVQPPDRLGRQVHAGDGG